MSLTDREWKEFFVKDIFSEVQRGKRLTRSNQTTGFKPYISSSALKNGVDNFIGNEKNVREFSKCITLANSGSVGSSFYHAYTFVASDHITHLKEERFNKDIYIFISMVLSRLSDKYNFNREINDIRISREKIMLPVNEQNEPDYDFMEAYIKEQEQSKTLEYISYAKKMLAELEYKDVVPLEDKKWTEFFIESICDIISGKDIYENERVSGQTPYITSTAQNNGIKYYVSNTNATLESNAISVNRNGSVGYSFYHKYTALYSNDCRKLRLKYVKNEFVSLFLTNQISHQKEKYNYGYKMGTGRLKRQKIMLPTDNQEKPDYAYMEQYMKNIMHQKYSDYLNYLNVDLNIN